MGRKRGRGRKLSFFRFLESWDPDAASWGLKRDQPAQLSFLSTLTGIMPAKVSRWLNFCAQLLLRGPFYTTTVQLGETGLQRRT